jgi:hypothetical protein
VADSSHLEILAQGVASWNRWREGRSEITADLSAANLHGRDLNHSALAGVNLAGADLAWANLVDANLVGANLHRADLRVARLSRADLRQADLRWANLADSIVNGANLAGADLQKADLSGANLDAADFSEARFGWTALGNVDLGRARGLATVRHQGPSTIGIDTIFRSKCRVPEAFLRGAGVPEHLIRYVGTQLAGSVDFSTCFISYSGSDRAFADRLHADLQAHGVRCWYFPEDASIGKPVWDEIDRATKVYDRLIVICSADSLRSGPVLREIERALQREDSERRNDILFPVRIDDYVFKNWQHYRKPDVIAKVVGDFSGWNTDERKYETELIRILTCLQSRA